MNRLDGCVTSDTTIVSGEVSKQDRAARSHCRCHPITLAAAATAAAAVAVDACACAASVGWLLLCLCGLLTTIPCHR